MTIIKIQKQKATSNSVYCCWDYEMEKTTIAWRILKKGKTRTATGFSNSTSEIPIKMKSPTWNVICTPVIVLF